VPLDEEVAAALLGLVPELPAAVLLEQAALSSMVATAIETAAFFLPVDFIVFALLDRWGIGKELRGFTRSAVPGWSGTRLASRNALRRKQCARCGFTGS